MAQGGPTAQGEDGSDASPSGGGEARSQPLTADRIVRETLALIDEQGIGAATMRMVGSRLGVRAMALYRYISSREDLFDAVVERVVSELDDDPELTACDASDWQGYLSGLAWSVRRYARAHPHAFPLVATRPPDAPWVNPPLRSLRWIEAMLQHLANAGFSDDQILFTYRSYNSFLLGYLLLETSAMVIDDPKPGDGSFQAGDGSGEHDPVSPADPVPGAISPTRTTADRQALADSATPGEVMALSDDVDPVRFPVIHRLRAGLTENRFEAEFAAGLDVLIARIGAELDRS